MPDSQHPTTAPSPSELLDRNHAWAAGMTSGDADFFKRLVAQQTPKYLWIGCSDSRVPANQIVGMAPGEMFVHRNIANLVVHSDLNCLSVLQYAVEVLQIEHVIVCGHYGCGGIRAALDKARLGLIDNWLQHVQDVAQANREVLDQISPAEQWDRLCEMNVLAQVGAVTRTSIVQDAWARGQQLSVRGWIYGLRNGILRELTVVPGAPGGQ